MIKLIWPRVKIYDEKPGAYTSYEYNRKQKEWNRTSFEIPETERLIRQIAKKIDRETLDEILRSD